METYFIYKQCGHDFNRKPAYESYPGYKIDEKNVSAHQAFQHAMNVTGKYLDEYSWCW